MWQRHRGLTNVSPREAPSLLRLGICRWHVSGATAPSTAPLHRDCLNKTGLPLRARDPHSAVATQAASPGPQPWERGGPRGQTAPGAFSLPSCTLTWFHSAERHCVLSGIADKDNSVASNRTSLPSTHSRSRFEPSILLTVTHKTSTHLRSLST